ncbi:MAG: peptidoglycan-binding protein [Deltaproteobacteria bacterium]|nr:peptidoglycan-binding protein [Deltaproteobacteria bacterium]
MASKASNAAVANRASGAAAQARTAPGAAHVPKTIRSGSQGAEVRMVQTLLKKVGLAPGVIDGMFGPATHRAVVQFQEKRGLQADGIVGPDTWTALRERSGSDLDVSKYSTPTSNRGGDSAPRPGQNSPRPGQDGQRPGRLPPANPQDEAALRQEILRVAESQIGTVEKGENRGAVLKYQQHFGRGPEPWCADFVSWVYSQAGKATNSPYCPTFVQQLKKQGRWKGRNDPQPGDLVFFDWDGDKNPDHVGIVKAVNADGSITTIEGNTANPKNRREEGVFQKNREMNTVFGFGEVA